MKLSKLYSPAMFHWNFLAKRQDVAFKAINQGDVTAVAVRGTDNAVLVAQEKHLKETPGAEISRHIHKLWDTIGCIVAGTPDDSFSFIKDAQNEIAKWNKWLYGREVCIDILSKRISDINQKYIHSTRTRPLACCMILAGYSEDSGPKIYKINPAGYSSELKATFAGPNQLKANIFLKKEIVRKNEFRDSETTETAIKCLSVVLATNLKASEIEIGIISKHNPIFRVLTREEVNVHLAAVAGND